MQNRVHCKIKKYTQKAACDDFVADGFFIWQGRRDSNTQPTVLETATLPLSHSPKPNHYTTIKNKSQLFWRCFYSFARKNFAAYSSLKIR